MDRGLNRSAGAHAVRPGTILIGLLAAVLLFALLQPSNSRASAPAGPIGLTEWKANFDYFNTVGHELTLVYKQNEALFKGCPAVDGSSAFAKQKWMGAIGVVVGREKGDSHMVARIVSWAKSVQGLAGQYTTPALRADVRVGAKGILAGAAKFDESFKALIAGADKLQSLDCSSWTSDAITSIADQTAGLHLGSDGFVKLSYAV